LTKHRSVHCAPGAWEWFRQPQPAGVGAGRSGRGDRARGKCQRPGVTRKKGPCGLVHW
jgi:hypothetical protein